MRRRPLSMVCLIIVLFLWVGTCFAGNPPDTERTKEGQRVTLTGKVYKKEWVTQEEKERKTVYLHVTKVQEGLCDTGEKTERQNVICYLKSGQSLPEIGSTVKVEGRLRYFEKPSNPGQFDAESYYHILKISFQLNQTEIQEKTDTYNQAGEKLWEIRKYFSDILEKSLSGEDASVMKTMLLGEKSAVYKEIKALYQRNGIAHILAISGLHISLLGMTLFKIQRKAGLSIKAASWTSMVVILLYGLMTGFSVSSLRAAIMFMVHMAAQLCGRTYDRITAAFLAALLLLFYQPFYLYDSSFLFSFGCVFAIGFLVPALTEELKHQEKPQKVLKNSFLSGAAITMAGIPLQLCFFYRMPLYGTFLNLLVIPLMGLLVSGGILLLLFHKIPLLRFLTASFVTGMLAVFEKICILAESLPFHTLLPGRPSKLQTGIYLLVLAIVILGRKKLSLWKKWFLVLCGAVILFLPGKRELTVTFLDVGQGECIHIRTAAGRNYLIDGGSTSVSQAGTYRIIPYLQAEGVSTLEAVFITHPDADHYNGIVELMEEGKEQGISINHMYLPGVSESSKTEAFGELAARAESNGISVGYISKGQSLCERDFRLICLHPEKGYESISVNEYSTVLLLEYGDFRALLTGDVEGQGEEELLQNLEEMREGKTSGLYLEKQNLTVLKAAHHGSAGSTGNEILDFLSPVYTVISCGEDNPYGHPHEELLERLKEHNSRIFITYETGAITFRTDGRRLEMESFLSAGN